MNEKLSGLYAITDSHNNNPQQLISDVEQALQGGAGIIQYRNKCTPFSQRLETCRQLRTLTDSFDSLLIINDDVELAKQSAADGVHLGKDDTDVKTAREYLATNSHQPAIIGVSCYNQITLAQQAVKDGADYIAFGRFFPSRTKPDAALANPGILKQAKQICNLPIVAIGGITAENGAALIEAGADMLAVIDNIFCHSPQPEEIKAAANHIQALFE